MGKKWIIREVGNDDYDVLVGGRTVKSGLTEQEARKLVRDSRSGDDRAFVEETDGYRTKF